MNSTFFITLALAFCCFLLPAIVYNRVNSHNDAAFNSRYLFFPLCISILIFSVTAFLLFYDSAQFLTSMTMLELVLPLLLSMLIYIIDQRIPRLTPIAIVISAGLCVSVIPADALAAITPFPPLYNKLLLTAACTLFCYIFKYTNSEDSITLAQAITICAGISVLGFINAIPLLIGIIALLFVAGFLALFTINRYPARAKLSNIDTICIGFIVFALMTWATTENALGCVIIYNLYLVIDLAIAFLLWCSFAPQYKNIMRNTACAQAIRNGIAPENAISFSYRIQLLLLFFGSFQALSPNKFSLILVSTLITAWLLYRLHDLHPEKQTANDVARNALEDMQEQINDLKQHIDEEDKF